MSLLFVMVLVVYLATSYGGIRSPDSEIVYLTAQSISRLDGVQVPTDLPTWQGFGVAKGRGGRLYSIFGPVQSIVAAPLIALARSIDRTGWYESAPFPIPVSHYVGFSIANLRAYGTRPTELEPHAERFLVALFLNPLVTAATVVVFSLLLLRLGITPLAVGLTAVLYAFGSLAWPYAGTFFSEPLATFWTLLSLLLIVPPHDRKATIRPFGPASLLLSGLFLGLGTGTHLTAILFAPFFAICAWGYRYQGVRSIRRAAAAPIVWAIGLSVPMIALGFYNHYRFGHFLETGRYLNPIAAHDFNYGQFILPLFTLPNLLLSSGKGLLCLCPAVIIGCLGWRKLRRRDSLLAWMLAVAAGFRLLFIAARSDWHGGFSLGPRYLEMLVPFLLIPAAFVADAVLASRSRLSLAALLAGSAACCSQQLAFTIGEIFLYYHHLRVNPLTASAFQNQSIYTVWSYSPVLHVLSMPRAPFLWQRLSCDNVTLWLIPTGVIVLLAAACFLWVRSRVADHVAKTSRAG